MSSRIRLISIQRDDRYSGVHAVASIECPACQHVWLLSAVKYDKKIRECPECGYKG